MIDKDSANWGYDEDMKRFLATDTMQAVRAKFPDSIPYFVSTFNEKPKPEDIMEQYRDWYLAAMKEYES